MKHDTTDIPARAKMADAIQRYLDDKITAFEFDRIVNDTASSSNDKTVKEIARTFWYFYDDVKDHRVIADRDEWNFLHRLLLTLQSGGRIETTCSRYRWGISQCIACGCLAAIVTVIAKTGFRDYRDFLYVLVNVPFGLVSMALAYWNGRRRRGEYRALSALVPFSSITEILSARRKAPGFNKTKYPKRLESRRLRSSLGQFAMWPPTVLLWLLFSPLPLIFQSLPERDSTTRVVTT